MLDSHPTLCDGKWCVQIRKKKKKKNVFAYRWKWLSAYTHTASAQMFVSCLSESNLEFLTAKWNLCQLPSHIYNWEIRIAMDRSSWKPNKHRCLTSDGDHCSKYLHPNLFDMVLHSRCTLYLGQEYCPHKYMNTVFTLTSQLKHKTLVDTLNMGSYTPTEDSRTPSSWGLVLHSFAYSPP